MFTDETDPTYLSHRAAFIYQSPMDTCSSREGGPMSFRLNNNEGSHPTDAAITTVASAVGTPQTRNPGDERQRISRRCPNDDEMQTSPPTSGEDSSGGDLG